MAQRILGISAFYHDSAAALVVDGRVVAAAQEERFSRVKHDPRFPTRAVAACLAEAGVGTEALDYIAFYEKPLSKFDRLIETYLGYAPAGFASFRKALPAWAKEKLHHPRAIRKGLPGPCSAPIVFVEHHESHAASAFFPSPFESAAILTFDGVGEWASATRGTGSGRTIRLTDQIRFPHSLGLLYSAFTAYCGFKVNSGEYKLMGLAPYGRPIHRETILDRLIDLKDDGSFRLDLSYFRYPYGLTMTSGRFHDLFGGPPRRPESDLTEREMDLAASIQAVTEEVVLRSGRDLHRRTGLDRLVMAGGVALNCVANGRLAREGPFKSIWVQPAAGDAGGAVGAALFVWHQLLENSREPDRPDAQSGSLLGPAYSTAEIVATLRAESVPFEMVADEADLMDRVAAGLDSGQVVGWFQGRSEFGPRALGARSILADPRPATMQSDLNLKIKYRESFRPFAPCVLAERAADWFDVLPGFESPYMLMTAPVRPSRLVPLSEADRARMATDPDMRRRVGVVRSEIPAVTHVDGSARLQTVDAARNPRLHALLSAFERRTGCPVLVNTSFNVRGEPIVQTPLDALRCFQATEMDVLVMGDVLVRKGDVVPLDEIGRRRHLAGFGLD